MSLLAFYDLLYLILALPLFCFPQLVGKFSELKTNIAHNKLLPQNPSLHQWELFNHLLPVLLPLAHISLTGANGTFYKLKKTNLYDQ